MQVMRTYSLSSTVQDKRHIVQLASVLIFGPRQASPFVLIAVRLKANLWCWYMYTHHVSTHLRFNVVMIVHHRSPRHKNKDSPIESLLALNEL